MLVREKTVSISMAPELALLTTGDRAQLYTEHSNASQEINSNYIHIIRGEK